MSDITPAPAPAAGTGNSGDAGKGTILVGFDGSANAGEALAWALDEAAVRGCRVEVLSVLQVPALAYGAPGYLPPTLDRYQKEMETVVEEALGHRGRSRHGAAALEIRVAEGSPAVLLAERSRNEDVVLVVVGARGHGLLGELMLGSASHTLSHTCTKPVVIVPHGWAETAT